VNFEITIVGIGLAGKQRFRFATRYIGFETLKALLGFEHDLLVALALAELDPHEMIIELLLDTANRGELVLERGALLHHTLGA
jgi:hypothetical protein